MSLSELKRKGRIKPIPIDKEQINVLVNLSKRDLNFSKEIICKNQDWAFNVAYNSILQMSRALMYAYGFRTDESELHKTTFEFVNAVLVDKYGDLVGTFDRLRRKRNSAVYDEAGSISEFEAKFAIKSAEEFYLIGKKKINEKLK